MVAGGSDRRGTGAARGLRAGRRVWLVSVFHPRWGEDAGERMLIGTFYPRADLLQELTHENAHALLCRVHGREDR